MVYILAYDGYRELDLDMFQPIFNHPRFQRLRRVKQLGTPISTVYSGANHDRMSHSLGTLAITHDIAQVLGSNSDEKKVLCAYALTHDLGHGPDSHYSEFATTWMTGINHHTNGARVIRELSEEFKRIWIDAEEIVEMLEKKNPLYQLVSNILGADKLDYTWRDNHHTGLRSSNNVSDTLRYIISMSTFEEGKYAMQLHDGLVDYVNYFVATMQRLYEEVYFAKPVLVKAAIFNRAVAHASKKSDINRWGEGDLDGSMWDFDDDELKIHLIASRSETARKLAKLLYAITPTYNIVTSTGPVTGLDDVPYEQITEDQSNRLARKYPTQAELMKRTEELEREFDISTGGLLIVNNPALDRFDRVNDIRVVENGEIKTIADDSIIRMLSKVRKERGSTFSIAVHPDVNHDKKMAITNAGVLKLIE